MNLTANAAPGKVMVATGGTARDTHHFARTIQAPVVIGQRSPFRGASVVIVTHGNVTRSGDAENVGYTYLGSGVSLEVPAELVRDLIDALETALAEAVVDPARMVLESSR